MRSRSSSTRRLASDRRRSSASWRSSTGGSGLFLRPMSGRDLQGSGHSDPMALDEQGPVQPGQALQVGEGRVEPVGLGDDGGGGGGRGRRAAAGRPAPPPPAPPPAPPPPPAAPSARRRTGGSALRYLSII